MSKRVLITGASGFVGANLARRLVADGHKVHLLLRPARGRWRLDGIEAEIHECSLEDSALAVAAARPEWIFHLAVYGAYPTQTHATVTMETNVLGTVALLNACVRAGFDAFVHAGTSSEYGPKAQAPSEEESLHPLNAYGVSKAAATLYCDALARAERQRISTLRLYSVYGPYEQPTRLMPTLLRAALAGRWPPLADPRSAHDFVFVDDVSDAFIAAAERGCRVYNIGTGIQTSLAELVAIVRDLFGVPAEPGWGTMPARPWDTSAWQADPSLAARELRWRAATPLRAGLEKTAEWLRSRPE